MACASGTAVSIEYGHGGGTRGAEQHPGTQRLGVPADRPVRALDREQSFLPETVGLAGVVQQSEGLREVSGIEGLGEPAGQCTGRSKVIDQAMSLTGDVAAVRPHTTCPRR